MVKLLYVTGAIWLFLGLMMLPQVAPCLIFVAIGFASIVATYIINEKLVDAKNEIAEAWGTAAVLKDQMESGLSAEEYNQRAVRMATEIPEIYKREKVDVQELIDKIEHQQNEINRLKEATNPEDAKLAEINTDIDNLEREKMFLSNDVKELEEEIIDKKKTINLYDDDIQIIEFGLYKPVYEFANSEMYKSRLETNRIRQKEMIKNGTATVSPDNYKLNGSLSQGKKIIKDNVKQILRSFNNESEVLISKVKFNNVDAYRQRIIKSYEQLNKLNERMEISITPQYLEAKLDELALAHEYAAKKQEEKELAKEERERLREEAKIQKEIEEERKRLNKEKTHYENALKTLEHQLAENPKDETLLAKKEELTGQIGEINKGIEDVDYREANKRAGYVYVISNIGSFGEGVYKIGMTRRLEPLDRVKELGDASVPFNFDVHAMIFSEDAPALETALHHAFENNRVNMVNNRREFFKVSLDEIERVVKENFEKAVEFTRVPDAEQYRESLKMLEGIAQ